MAAHVTADDEEWPLKLLLAAYLLASVAVVVALDVPRVADLDSFESDFDFFRGAADRIFEDPAVLYDVSLLESRRIDPTVGRFAYPPATAVLYWPLTLLPRGAAISVYVGVSALAALGIAGLGAYWARQTGIAWAPALAVAGSWPVYEVIRLGHPSLLLALAAGLALLSWQVGRSTLAGLLISVLALKPPLVIAPLGLAAWQRKGRTVKAALAGVAVFVVLPFLVLGLGVIEDYLDLLSTSRYDAFHLFGRIHSGASLMLNWNGFLARLALIDPAPLLVLPFYLATVLLMVRVWTRGGLEEAWLAGSIATMLALPHALYYDWVLLLPPAIALACTRESGAFIALLVFLHFSVNLSVYQIVPFDNDRAFFLATPAALALLVWLAFSPRALDAPVSNPNLSESRPMSAGTQISWPMKLWYNSSGKGRQKENR